MAISLPEVVRLPHFHLVSFRVRNKIFATIHEKENRVMLKLRLLDQSVFCAFDKAVIYPVPGGWGRKGATFFDLEKMKVSMMKDALTAAWASTAPKKLVEEFRRK